MGSPFCDTCGTLLTPKKRINSEEMILWCSKCKKEVRRDDKTLFKDRSQIEHKPKDFTRILEDEPPPVPKLFTQPYSQRKKSRCRHPNAVFKGFYQFSRGDEASRKYWYCPDCGHVFRYSGKVEVKANRRIIDQEEE